MFSSIRLNRSMFEQVMEQITNVLLFIRLWSGSRGMKTALLERTRRQLDDGWSHLRRFICWHRRWFDDPADERTRYHHHLIRILPESKNPKIFKKFQHFIESAGKTRNSPVRQVTASNRQRFAEWVAEGYLPSCGHSSIRVSTGMSGKRRTIRK